MLSIVENNRSRSNDNSQRKGIVSFDSIDWDKFKNFDRKQSFLEFSNHTLESARQLPRERLIDLQTEYYSMKERKKTELLFPITPPGDRNETVTCESRKRGADNSLQFDRIMKSSKPSLAAVPSNKLLNGIPYFKKGYFDEVSLDIGTRNK